MPATGFCKVSRAWIKTIGIWAETARLPLCCAERIYRKSVFGKLSSQCVIKQNIWFIKQCLPAFFTMFHWVFLALQTVTLKRVCGKKSKCGNLAESNLSSVLWGVSGGVICALDFFVDRIFYHFPCSFDWWQLNSNARNLNSSKRFCLSQIIFVWNSWVLFWI